MRSLPHYVNSLSVSPFGKSVPYIASVVRKDGNTNYGFKNLKLKPDLIDTIPELALDNTLKSLVRSLNLTTNFFSTGCFSHHISQNQSYKHCGYIEFSLNCRNCVQDAHNYFSLFFHFEQILRNYQFSQCAKFDWKVGESDFLDVGLTGFTCAVFVQTSDHSTFEGSAFCWQQSLQMLESFFISVPDQCSVAIYQNIPTPQKTHFGYLQV
jgi:hypothetical protein